MWALVRLCSQTSNTWSPPAIQNSGFAELICAKHFAQPATPESSGSRWQSVKNTKSKSPGPDFCGAEDVGRACAKLGTGVPSNAEAAGSRSADFRNDRLNMSDRPYVTWFGGPCSSMSMDEKTEPLTHK